MSLCTCVGMCVNECMRGGVCAFTRVYSLIRVKAVHEEGTVRGRQ